MSKELEEGYAPAVKGPRRIQRWVDVCGTIDDYIEVEGTDDSLLIKEADEKEKRQFVFSTSYKELREEHDDFVFSIRSTENKKGFWVFWRRR